VNWTVAALLLLAMVLANLPFLSERLFLVWRFKSGRKAVSWRIVELVGYYFLTGAVAYWMESRLGPVYGQKWEFYAVTACLFVVFAYPGFVYRYLWRRPEP
jgi:Na+(H+)/acetate symporter ActP